LRLIPEFSYNTKTIFRFGVLHEKITGVDVTNNTGNMKNKTDNLAASTSWKPQGLSRPVMGFLYLLMG
jgi:hypothetical protein